MDSLARQRRTIPPLYSVLTLNMFVFLQLPPLSHSAYPTPPKNISASSFPSVFSFLLIPFYVLPVVSFSFLRVILLHNDLLLSLLSHFLSHDALTIL